jgi:predicted RNA-binding protein YlqC (UPF0109 family)
VKDLVNYIAKQLVDSPDQVRVHQSDREEGITLELHVASDDLGRVIGRDGRTVKAMRTLLSAASANRGKRVVLEIPD